MAHALRARLPGHDVWNERAQLKQHSAQAEAHAIHHKAIEKDERLIQSTLDKSLAEASAAAHALRAVRFQGHDPAAVAVAMAAEEGAAMKAATPTCVPPESKQTVGEQKGAGEVTPSCVPPEPQSLTDMMAAEAAEAGNASEPKKGSVKTEYHLRPEGHRFIYDASKAMAGTNAPTNHSVHTDDNDSQALATFTSELLSSMEASLAPGALSSAQRTSNLVAGNAKGEIPKHVAATRGGEVPTDWKSVIQTDVSGKRVEVTEKVADAFAGEVWMLQSKFTSAASRMNQSYIVRSMLECIAADGLLSDRVVAIDSDSSLQLALGELLQNVREIKPSNIDTIAGSLCISSVGDLVLPHPVCGSMIVEAVNVKPDELPTGCSALLGRAGINACQLDVTRLGRVPPSIVPRALYAHGPVPEGASFGHEVKDKLDKWHPVCWDGVIDTRVGKRAFVLFKDGSSSLVRFTHIRDATTKSPPSDMTRCPRCVLSTCNEPVEQGMCPKFCGRRSACSIAHYLEARDQEAFVHPGFISPGIVFTSNTTPIPSVPHIHGEANATKTSYDALVLDAEASLDDVVEACEAAMHGARADQLPRAWLDAAAGDSNVDYVSLFDGGNAAINVNAQSLGLVGLPPVDINGKWPINM